MSFTIADITPRVAARLNDAAQTKFTDAVLLPYCLDACEELQNKLQLYGIPVLSTIATAIDVPQNTLNMGVLLPADLLIPQRLEERLHGSTDLYAPMTRRQWEPDILPTDSLRYWTYRNQDIFFVGATSDRDVKIYYLKLLLNPTATSFVVVVNNCKQFLINRIAALAARFVGENPTRADALDTMAAIQLEDLIGIGVKSKQGTRARRRPFVIIGRRRWT